MTCPRESRLVVCISNQQGAIMRNTQFLFISLLSSLLLCGCSGLIEELTGAIDSSGDEAEEGDHGGEAHHEADGDHGHDHGSAVATASVSADGTVHASVGGVSATVSGAGAMAEVAATAGAVIPPRPTGEMPWDRSGPSLSAIDVGEGVSTLLESCQMHLEGGNRDWAEAACLSGIKKGKSRDYSRMDRLYYRLGKVYESARRKDDAILAYHEALRQNSDNKYARKRLEKLID